MAASDTLCFADFDPVTGAPNIDGFFLADAGVITYETEPGYVNGSRMTFGGSGFPPAVFQGVKSGNFLTLAFLARLDLSFDAEDVIVVALRPSQANQDQSTARRIDIFPVYEGVGTDEQNTTTGGPAGTPDDSPAGVPAGQDYHVRTNHAPAKLVFYKGQTGVNVDPWSTYTPAIPAAFTVKVRSWRPPTASGSPDEYAWSIELQVPLTATTGGADWINLADQFGLYFNVIRVGKVSAAGPTPSQGWFSTQFRFPQQVSANVLTGLLDTKLNIDPTWYGTGLIPALQTPPGSNFGLGVRFASDAFGPRVGHRDAGSGSSTLDQTISGTTDNELVAVVENTSTTDAAPKVTAEFRFANWGLGPPNFFAWAKPSGLLPNPTNSSDLAPSASNIELQSNWPAASVPPAYKPPNQHQCMWVQLNSVAAVNFIQSSVRRNMDFIGLSEFERPAEISGVGYPAPPGGGSDHDFLLFTHTRRILIFGDRREALAQQPSNQVRYLWITEGYRRTGRMLTIGSKLTEVLDEGPGAFGFVASHVGVTDNLRWELSGPGLRRHGRNVHSIKVPHNGKVTINTSLKTEAAGGGGGLKLPWWVWLLLAVFGLLLIYLLI